MFRWVALASAVVFVVAFAGVIVSRPSMPPNQQEQSAEHKDEHANKEGYKTLWDTWFPDSLSLYTLALVVFTAVLAFGGLYQLRTLERAERISAEAANAAKDAANATRDAVKLAEGTAERQLRAYIGIDNPQLDQIKNLSLHIRNFGSTPAYEVRVLTRRTDPSLEESAVEHAFGIIEPGANPPAIVPLDDLDFDEIISGKVHFRINVKIYFRDVFAKSWVKEADYFFFPRAHQAGEGLRLHVAPNTAKESQTD